MRLRFSPADGAVIVAVVTVALALLLFRGAGGDSVSVTTDGGTVRYPLSVAREIPVESAGHRLVVRITDGGAAIVEADCPDRICVATGLIRTAGQTAVCVPSHVIVKIENSGGAADADWILP